MKSCLFSGIAMNSKSFPIFIVLLFLVVANDVGVFDSVVI